MKTRSLRRRWFGLVIAALMVSGVMSVGGAAAAGVTGGTVTIQTVPALAGVHLSVAGALLTTGATGAGAVQVTDLNGIASKVSLAGDVLDAVDTLSIARVQPSAHTAKHESHLTVGLDIVSRVTLSVSTGSTGVPAWAVHSVRLHSVTGQVLTVDPRQTPTVDLRSRVTRLSGGSLVTQVVTWSVDSVLAGTGVSVSAKQPAFDPFGHPIWQLQLQPVRGTVVIDTIPKTPGVMFSLDGGTITTNGTGQGQGVVADLNNVDQRLQLATPSAGAVSVSVIRVTKLPPGARFQRHLLVALSQRRPVVLTFADAAGKPVSAALVSQVRLQGGGTTVTLTGQQIDQPVSLLSSLATEVNSVWQPRQLTYSVSSVRLDGSNGVFAGQQRFNPNTTTNWPISVAVFNVSVTVRDVVFGSRIKSSVWVTRPDGNRYQVELRTGSATVLTSLVRGSYDLDVQSAMFGSHTKVLVSRSDQVNLRVVTSKDILVMVVVAALLCGALIWLGLSRRRAHTRRRVRTDPA